MALPTRYALDLAGLLVAMALAGVIGSRVGRHGQPRTDDAGLGHVGSVLGLTLGLWLCARVNLCHDRGPL